MSVSVLRAAAIAAVFTCSAAFVSSASAAISATNVTTPAHGTKRVVDASTNMPDPNITVSGTATGGSGGDTVDIVCAVNRYGFGLTLLNVQPNVPAGSGSFTFTGPPASSIDGERCTLLAIPTGTPIGSLNDLANYTGPWFYSATVAHWKFTSGTNIGQEYNWMVQTPEDGAYNSFRSIGDLGLYFNYLMTGTGPVPSEASTLWDGSGITYSPTAATEADFAPSKGGNTSTTGIRIDGTKWGYTSVDASGFDGSNATGFPASQSSLNVSATGVPSITETQNLAGCADNLTLYPPAGNDCNAFTSLGVRLVRTIAVSDSGKLVFVTDTYTSTDNAAHQLELSFGQGVDGANDFTGPGWGITGGMAGATPVPTNGSKYPAPTAPWTVYTRSNLFGGDGTMGAIVGDQAPSSVQVDATDHRYVYYYFNKTVPAPPSQLVIRHAYAIGSSQSALSANVTAMQNLYVPPTISVKTPTEGSKVTATPVRITGLADDNVGVALITVNGVSTPRLPGGAYTSLVNVPTNGKKSVTVTVTDTAGNVTSLVRTFTAALITFTGTGGNDKITGNAASNIIDALGGNDTIACGVGGKDVVKGGAGNDKVNCVEKGKKAKAGKDTIDCGTGKKDVATVDIFDKVKKSCEKVIRKK